MAVKKSVAERPQSASIPGTASESVGELKATDMVTASQETETVEQTVSVTADTVARNRAANLAKARATKAAKQAAKALEARAETPRPSFQTAIAAEMAADRHSFGEIKAVPNVVPTAEEYVKVTIPLKDLFDHSHPGVQLNRHKFEPGQTYLLRGDVALEVRTRLAMFHDEQVRLLRPNADRKALNDVNRGSQWTSRGGNAIVPLGRLEDVPTASDEKIYTVDF